MLRGFSALSIFIFCFSAHYVYADNKVAIASAHPLATEAGFKVIAKGGNVYDAAVAISAALAVLEPYGSGLGGGAYWLLHREKDNLDVVVDAREKAPMAAHKNMYLDKNGKVIPKLSLDGALAAAIPGLPAGLVHLNAKYGLLPMAENLAPAISYAKAGFAIGERYLRYLKTRAETIKHYPASAKIFLDHSQNMPELYSILRQTDLARTLSILATEGRAGFYSGDVAEQLVKSVKQAGGIWTLADLENYQIIEKKPLIGNYKGIKVTSVPPSSSGGIALLQTLNILADYDLEAMPTAIRKHLIVEALRRAYHDRSQYLGDEDYVDVPINRLLNADYAAGLRSSIRYDKTLASSQLSGNSENKLLGANTTHFSIIDQEGNRVAATLSLNFQFGSAFVVPGTGVLLNDEMDDFDSQSGVMNVYGLLGGTANSIAPGKRMLSSMTPTFLETEKSVAVLGTPGGSRIISMVLLAALDFAKETDPDSWVNLPRFHHQFMPDVLEYEKSALTDEEINTLKQLGHQLKEVPIPYGDMQAVLLNKFTKSLSAASDKRGEGRAQVSQ